MQCHAPYFQSVACPALLCVSTLAHKHGKICKRKKEKVIEHKMCVLIFSKNFVLNISHSKKN